MPHFHRCRFDVRDSDGVQVRETSVTVEADGSWIDVVCTDPADANRLAVAFAQLAHRLEQAQAQEVCVTCGEGEPFVLTPDGRRLCGKCAAVAEGITA